MARKRSLVGLCSIAFLSWILVSQWDFFAREMQAGQLDGLVLCGCVLILVCMFGWHWVLALRLLLSPRSHPIYREAIDEVEKQVRESGHKVGPAIFTGQFLLNPSTMALMHYRDIMWIYRRQTRHATEMIIYTRDGQQRGVAASRKMVDQLILTVEQICPWVVVGYSDQLWSFWSDSRAQFLADVDARQA